MGHPTPGACHGEPVQWPPREAMSLPRRTPESGSTQSGVRGASRASSALARFKPPAFGRQRARPRVSRPRRGQPGAPRVGSCPAASERGESRRLYSSHSPDARCCPHSRLLRARLRSRLTRRTQAQSGPETPCVCAEPRVLTALHGALLRPLFIPPETEPVSQAQNRPAGRASSCRQAAATARPRTAAAQPPCRPLRHGCLGGKPPRDTAARGASPSSRREQEELRGPTLPVTRTQPLGATPVPTPASGFPARPRAARPPEDSVRLCAPDSLGPGRAKPATFSALQGVTYPLAPRRGPPTLSSRGLSSSPRGHTTSRVTLRRAQEFPTVTVPLTHCGSTLLTRPDREGPQNVGFRTG